MSLYGSMRIGIDSGGTFTDFVVLRGDGRWQNTTGPGRAVNILRGPALITDYGSTTFVPEGWTATRDHAGSLILRAQ